MNLLSKLGSLYRSFTVSGIICLSDMCCNKYIEIKTRLHSCSNLIEWTGAKFIPKSFTTKFVWHLSESGICRTMFRFSQKFVWNVPTDGCETCFRIIAHINRVFTPLGYGCDAHHLRNGCGSSDLFAHHSE